MENIGITQEEQKLLEECKDLKELTFCYQKYRSDDAEYLNSIRTWKTLKYKIRTEDRTGNLLEREGNVNTKYRSIYASIQKIRKAFNIQRTPNYKNVQEVLFWYSILIRSEQHPRIWSNIRALNNSDPARFVKAYQYFSSLSLKQEFLEEIEYFIISYHNLIGSIYSDTTPNDTLQILKKATNLDMLNILLSFDQFEIQDFLKDLHLILVHKLYSDPSTLEYAQEYHKYVTSIKEKITNIIKETNQEFSNLQLFYSPKMNDLAVNTADTEMQQTPINIDFQRYFDIRKAITIRECNTKVLYSLLNENSFDDNCTFDIIQSRIPAIFTDNLQEDPRLTGAILNYIVKAFKILDPEFYSELTPESIQLFMNTLPTDQTSTDSSNCKVLQDFAKIISAYSDLASYLIVRPHLLRRWGIGYL